MVVIVSRGKMNEEIDMEDTFPCVPDNEKSSVYFRRYSEVPLGACFTSRGFFSFLIVMIMSLSLISGSIWILL